MDPTKTTFRPKEGFVPNPKLRLREQLGEVMRFKQFSHRTEEAYWVYIRQFILFHGKRHPRELGKAEVEAFLSHLTTARKVAVSTQNQALNALVFLYREVLHLSFDELGAVERPLRRPKVPVVLSQAETARLLGMGDPTPNAPKWFAAVEMIRLATDQDWLHKATKDVAKHWRQKRERGMLPCTVN